MMDCGQQQHVQLATPPRRGSSSSPESTTAAACAAGMCPALYRAVCSGQINDVMALLLRQHGAAAASPHDDDHQATGRVVTRQHGRCDVLELSAEGNTVLHVAAEHGNGDLIRELCLRFRDKADDPEGLLSRRNAALDTPLHCAARAGRVRAVAALVDLAQERGIILGRCRNAAGDMALHLAARQGHDEAVEALAAAAPAAAAEVNNAGASPMYLAAVSGSEKALRSIVSRCGDAASCAGPRAQNALHAAVFRSLEMVQLLLKWRPALADEADSDGSTPLHFASSNGDLPIVHAILRAAPPTTVYRKDLIGGHSALHVAARMGHDGVVRELLRICPDAGDLWDNGGGTFLHAAAKEKRSSIAWLATGEPILRGLLDTRDGDGNTPLHLAVAAGSPQVVETLLRKGKVRADVLNDDGHTPFDLVEKSTSFFTMVNQMVILVAYGAQSRPQRLDHLKPWSGGDNIGQGIEKASEGLAVVAGLIVATAFAAGFQLPGGYGNNGTANLKDKPAFPIFIFFNTVSVATSVATVVLLVYGKVSRSAGSRKSFIAALHLFWMSLNSMMLAFYVAIAAVSNKSNRAVWVVIFVIIAGLNLWITVRIAPATGSPFKDLRFLWHNYFNTRQHAIIKRQYPLAATSQYNLILYRILNVVVSVCFVIFFNPSSYSYLTGRHNVARHAHVLA